MTDRRLHALRAELESVAAPGLAKCSSPESPYKRRAIEDVAAALRVADVSQRQFARIVKRDESSVRDWLGDGRKALPAWAVYALPREARIALLRRWLLELEEAEANEEADEGPPSTGTHG